MDNDLTAFQDLIENGPVIDVRVNGHSVRALVDTGAAVTCIRPDVGCSLALREKDKWYDTYRNEVFAVYEVDLEVQGKHFPDHEINAYRVDPQKPFVLILGRDILVSFVFEYDGPRGAFVLR